ncbi:SPASM domain-containing protein [Lacrimispora sp.]|uniref:SPASM domain-containing protein n=1 Tax=Lacrimispora sp. TaxID=2719234 RepID=UPI0032E39920
MIIYKDEVFKFFEIFNEENGTLIRSDVNGVNPIMRSFPELLDVGIMGHCDSGEYCKRAGVDCYQNGRDVYAPHMTIKDFAKIAKQAAGKTFQIALGGAGDPNKHPQFETVLQICRTFRIVPNMTTSGFLMTKKEMNLIKRYCGAVAVSWYSRLNYGVETNQETINATKRLLELGCTTNIHFVVSKDTIDEAIIRLEQNLFPDGINAVVFILYKPVGGGIVEKVLEQEDNRLEKFFSVVTEKMHPYRIGFDTCFTPAILRWGGTIPPVCIDACEAATFSMYIDSQMNCYPCSFGIWDKRISESMYDKTLREIWMGEKFDNFRSRKKERCTTCNSRLLCQDGCRLGVEIDLCNNGYITEAAKIVV